MKRELSREARRLVWALGATSGISFGLLITRVVTRGSLRYSFLVWNLALAWLPLILAWWLAGRLQREPWWKWQNIVLTLLWLSFLPNSFYVLSDFVHLINSHQDYILYDTAMLLSFSFSGLALGLISLFTIHYELLKRFPHRAAHIAISVILALCSFAIYLGRFLRWNSWDILLRPAGLLFDVSDRFINPQAHGRTFVTTITFFLVIGSMYLVLWQLVRLLETANHDSHASQPAARRSRSLR